MTFAYRSKGLFPVLSGLIVFGLFLSALFFYFGDGSWGGKKADLHIAVVGPMSGENAGVGQAMRRAVEYQVERMRDRGDPLAERIELLVYDDGNDPAQAGEVARAIAQRQDVLAVIGHQYSSAALAAGRVYKEYGIPAITASATDDKITRDNPWFFRNANTNSLQGSLIANYLAHILKQSTVTIIFDRDEYGTSLAHSFSAAAEKLGLTVKNQWGFDASDEGFEADLESISDRVIGAGDPGTIFLAAHSVEGARFVARLKHFGPDFSFIGADALANESFLQTLEQFPLARFEPGYYSDGIHVLAPFLLDTANQSAQQLNHAFLKRHGEALSRIDAGYFDAAGLVTDAISQSVSGDDGPGSPGRHREAIRKYLSERIEPGNAYRGSAGEIYFDIHRNLAKPMWIGRYQDRHLLSAPVQFQPVKTWIGIDDPLEEILAGRIFLVDEQFFHRLQVIYVGLDINAITDLSIPDETYRIDAYLWFRFPGEFDDAEIEFVNAVEEPVTGGGTVEELVLGEPIVAHTEQGITTRTYRIKGKFKGEFLLHDFPFDKQRIELRFRHQHHTIDKLIYVPDLRGMRDTKLPTAGPGFPALTGWKTGKALFHQDVLQSNTTLGLPEYFGQDTRVEYSQFNAVVEIERESLRFITKTLLPLFFVLILIYLSYFIAEFGTRMGLGTSALMTTAFFHLSSSTTLQVSYLIALEYFFFLLYFLTGLSILGTLVMNYHRKPIEEAPVPALWWLTKGIDKGGRIAQPLLIGAFCLWMLRLFA
ncbi:MAG: amino acid/amide ABC transporter substrate-binding protein, HAAT family [Candidatus Kentron sp. G]|nr:MAG: amino acid/amide ABC transporter substrate-binding protein, HAAT family [Candidatus Kentron sp. G]